MSSKKNSESWGHHERTTTLIQRSYLGVPLGNVNYRFHDFSKRNRIVKQPLSEKQRITSVCRLLFLIFANRISACLTVHICRHTEREREREKVTQKRTLVTVSTPLFDTAKGRRVNETNALTMPTLITGPERPPNRWASARANYAGLLADRANRTVSVGNRGSVPELHVSCDLVTFTRLWPRWNWPDTTGIPFDRRCIRSFLFTRVSRQKKEIIWLQKVETLKYLKKQFFSASWNRCKNLFFNAKIIDT